MENLNQIEKCFPSHCEDCEEDGSDEHESPVKETHRGNINKDEVCSFDDSVDPNVVAGRHEEHNEYKEECKSYGNGDFPEPYSTDDSVHSNTSVETDDNKDEENISKENDSTVYNETIEEEDFVSDGDSIPSLALMIKPIVNLFTIFMLIVGTIQYGFIVMTLAPFILCGVVSFNEKFICLDNTCSDKFTKKTI